MRSCELVATITAIACAIANTCSEDEVNLMAAAFTQLGDTLATILAQGDINEKEKGTDKNQEDCNNNQKNNNNINTD